MLVYRLATALAPNITLACPEISNENVLIRQSPKPPRAIYKARALSAKRLVMRTLALWCGVRSH
jgi:hypothetical protein